MNPTPPPDPRLLWVAALIGITLFIYLFWFDPFDPEL